MMHECGVNLAAKNGDACRAGASPAPELRGAWIFAALNRLTSSGRLGPCRSLGAIAALCFAASLSPAAAALAPNYQRLAEMRAILDNPEVQAAFDVRRPIEGLTYLGPDHYQASGGGCHLDIRLIGVAMPDGMVGARRLKVQAGRLACR